MLFNIKDYRNYFNEKDLAAANRLNKRNAVSKYYFDDNGKVSGIVRDKRVYEVDMTLDEDGNVQRAICDCSWGYSWDCRHVAAVCELTAAEFKRRMDTSDKSSKAISMLIKDYNATAVSDEDVILADTPVRILPELKLHSGERGVTLTYSLTIGRDRQYVVKDITTLHRMFMNRTKHSYGKYFVFEHRLDALDERSRKLLDLTTLIYSTSGYYTRDVRNFTLTDMYMDNFFEIFKDSSLNMEGSEYSVKFAEPRVEFKVEPSTNGRYIIKTDDDLIFLGQGSRGIFLDKSLFTVYSASPKFTRSVAQLYDVCAGKDGLFISSNDMPQFYTAVLKKIKDLADVIGLEDLGELVPPDLESKLYIDMNDDNEVIARLEFNYGENKVNYSPTNNDVKGGYRDNAAEQIAVRRVSEYFEIAPHRKKNPFVISDEEKIIDLLTDGVAKLSDTMEIYASDRFKRISTRPPVKPVVGVRPGGSMLLVNISDENYTNEELVEILGAYRRGAKYHRLKNGSFAMINESVAELEELTKNLNITDKQMLKENLNIPRYRMMYLDSLKRSENFRLQRSEDFKKAVRKYRSDLEGTEATEVPAELEDTMRDYQRYGFRWLKTLSMYGFGGILADDMGLGKTLQSIALMLDAKQRSKKHIQNLVVCPATLTLNWESEIKRFAPELKPLTIIGTVAVRDQLFEQADEYDVIITSYTTLTRDIGKYEGRKFYLHFIDEAQYIKNHGTQMAKAVKAIDSQVRFALTGTPVENSLAELWSIFDFVMPDYLFNYNRFKKNIETPIVARKDENAVKALQKSVSPFILRRMKKEVLTELPDKTETVLTSMMEPEQRKVYTANAELLKQTLVQSGGDPAEKIKILAMMTRLRQLCCDPHLVYENFDGKSAKLEQCIDLVESCINAGHKILLFSQFTSMLAIIRQRFDEQGISYFELTGETKPKERIRMMNEFNVNDTQVFLISLKAGGTGLNLTGADIVIHYDPWWNVSAENQASDRVYRIGQRNNVQVYKLVADKSIEQNILKLQEAKKDLSELAVKGEGDIMHMSTDEIMSLL